MWHTWERRENSTRFWWESPKEREFFEDRSIDRIISKWILGRWAARMFSGLNWLRTGDSGELL
jgi:hypothetical protein